MAHAAGNPPLIVVVTLYYLLALFVVPVGLIALAVGRFSAGGANGGPRLVEVATRYAYALVPLGFGMWLAHHGFHFFTSYATIVPVAQRMAVDFGLAALGDPAVATCLLPGRGGLDRQVRTPGARFWAAVFAGRRLSHGDGRPAWQSSATRRIAPWAVLILLLFAIGVWIVLEPMQMRGTLPVGG